MAGSIAVSRIQLGDHTTATNNFVVRIPSTPNGSVVIANGNVGYRKIKDLDDQITTLRGTL